MLVQGTLWHHCLKHLEGEVPEQQFNTWVRPLQAVERDGELQLLAPNRFVVTWIENNLFGRIEELVRHAANDGRSRVRLEVGSRGAAPVEPEPSNPSVSMGKPREPQLIGSRFNPDFTFASFVEGKSNQLARAAAVQVAENPGRAYNPLFIYGGVGLGKTHLMHAVANLMRERNPSARIAYVHSERFVSDMVRALQHNTIAEFKQTYRTLDALLIDDIQFFAGKNQSQEEFFHTFNALLEGQQQIILSCDRYPKEVTGLEERLKSRFGWGLTVAVEPPELETCVAILMAKSQAAGGELPEEVAFFVAKRIRSNVRELEGALGACSRLRASPAGQSRSSSPARPSKTSWPRRNASSRSRTSRRPSRSTTKSASPTCFPSAAAVRSPARARWRWRLRASLRITASRKSATLSAAAITPPSCTPAIA